MVERSTVTLAYSAILWDGTPEAWDAIRNLDPQDCWADDCNPGQVHRYGRVSDIPVGSWVYTTPLLCWCTSDGKEHEA